ncbi:MAG: M56 family metallopeptidase [Flavobacteriaceae bacterium]|nr:M56 family metallopeptidase [Flavobacteriaceae bacterium]
MESSEAVINENINNLIVDSDSGIQFSDILIYSLWSIYSIGVVIFSIKFIANLLQIFFRIKRNKKVKTETFTSVLLKESIVPHTFLNFIFFNKKKFEKQLIPKEVILHEQTHANQKHSIDILIIELIQVIFWFHPILYIFNKSIKLNHEFLADQAVLKSGITTTNYQKILLAFSSNANYSPLANAINYSFIKKRFTVMKTQTSKKSIWLKSLLMLPLFSLLLFSFSSKVEIEKENTLIESYTEQEGATKQQIAEYNKLAKKYNSQDAGRMIIKKSEVERLNYLYNLMTSKQKRNAEPFPNIPPPPPPVKVIKGVNDIDSNIPPPPAPKVIKAVSYTHLTLPTTSRV